MIGLLFMTDTAMANTAMAYIVTAHMYGWFVDDPISASYSNVALAGYM